MNKWQEIQCDKDKRTERLQIPGGHLYVVTERGDFGGILNQMMAFVPATRAKS